MNLADFNRIAVVGISGSGKSTFSRRLAERTLLPLLHGDQLEWCADWQVRPLAEVKALHQDWIARPRWIIEGFMDSDRVERLNRADLIVDLDFAASLCAWRTLARMLAHGTREEMPAGCVDHFSWRFLAIVFRKKERQAIDEALSAAAKNAYVRLTSPRQAKSWLGELSAAH